jgi:hypothetical protein
MKADTVLTLACGVVLGFFGVVGTAQAAWFKRIHSSACYTLTWSDYFIHDEFFGLKNGGTGSKTLICPVNDDSNRPKSSAVQVSVFGQHFGIGSVVASACTKFWWNTGGSGVGFFCGAPTSRSSAGVFTLNPPINVAWATSQVNEFGYIRIDMTNSDALQGILIVN